MLRKLGGFLENKVIIVYLFIMLAAFPLFMHNMLYDITEAKRDLFLYSTLICALAWLVTRIMQRKSFNFKSLKWYDYAGVAFLICSLIGTYFSLYQQSAFDGSMSRYIGMRTYLVYGVAVVLVAFGNVRNSRIAIWLMELSGLAVIVLGICNHFYQDPLGIYVEMEERYIPIMVSTFGNVNVHSEYAGFLYVLAVLVWSLEEKKALKWFSFLTAVATGIGIMLCYADVGYIAVIFLALFGWFVLEKQSQVKRFLVVIGIFLLQHYWIKIEPLLGLKAGDEDMSAHFIAGNNLLWLIATVIFLLSLYLHCVEIGHFNRNLILRIWKILVCVGIGAFIVIFLLVNMKLKEASWNYPGLGYLYLDDHWGSDRGVIWRESLKTFFASDWKTKLFGYGPGTTRLFLLTNEYLPQIIGDHYVDNAHCEPLQLLINHGFIATVCYYLWLFGTLGTVLKWKILRISDNRKHAGKEATAIAMTVLSYMAMSLVSINLIHPVAMVMVLIGLCRCGEEK